jgi:ABC-type sugar transport system ATPase subunit
VAVGNGSRDGVHFRGTVEVVEYLGDEQLAHIALGDQPIVAKVPVDRKLENNADLDFSIARERVYLFDAETEQRIRQ